MIKTFCGDSIIMVYEVVLIVLELCIAYVSVNPIFVLNENQWLYISSALAQVVAALFGLTFAGYQFYQENMQKMIESDESLLDSVQALRMNFYNELRVLCYTVSFDVSCFIIAMILWKQNQKIFYFVGNFTFNNGVTFFVVSTILIVLFILKVADQDYLATISSQAKKRLDDERVKEEHGGNDLNKNNYFEFMRDFKQMETYIIDITSEIEQRHKLHIYKRMTLVDRIEMIGMYHGEMVGLLSRVNRVRKYRNYLVHGRGDNYVSRDMLEELQKVFYELKEKLEGYKKYGNL